MAFLQSATDTSNLTTYTFASQNLGTADAARYIVVGVMARSASVITISSVTVGGVSATISVQRTSGASASCVAGLAIAAVPSGTSGDVVITLSAGALRAGIALYRLVGINATPTDTDSSTASAPSVTLSVADGGEAIGAATGSTGTGGSATWAGITERSDDLVESQIVATTASDVFVSASTPMCTATFNLSVTDPVGVFASWAPAAAGGVKFTQLERGIRGLNRGLNLMAY